MLHKQQICPLVIGERLSARLLIVQCGQLAFVCVYIYIYICHTLIVWVRFLWSHPQTTGHVVLIRPGSRRQSTCEKIVREPKLNGPGAMWYWSDQWRRLTCEKVRARAEMKQGKSKWDRARE